MKITHLLAIGFIFICTAAGWFILAGALTVRTASMDGRLSREVAGNWGGEMTQKHPTVFYISPTSTRTRRQIQPHQSRVEVNLAYDPKRKGLLWYRTYVVDFNGEYIIKNPTPITQTVYLEFEFPASDTRYDRFALEVDGQTTGKSPADGKLTEAVILDADAEVPVTITYRSAGTNRWHYNFGDNKRIRDFSLSMTTDFKDINIPAGTESPTSRETVTQGQGWNLLWEYSAVIGARAIGMDMPKALNPGPVATRMTFFAPVSLLFFFAVVVILGLVKGVSLHPMNYFFLAAGCFAFQLLFAYLVDLVPTTAAFVVAAAVSLVLVNGYIARVAGAAFARLTALAQFAYMVLFSSSFFFDGLTGITITVGAIITLALLMMFTARTNWSDVFTLRRKSIPGNGPGPGPAPGADAGPPPLPQQAG